MEIAIRFKFQSILRLEIWHDYFLGKINNFSKLPAGYDVSEAISLVPTQECQKVLRNLRWLFRPQPYGALLLAHVDTKTKGLTPIVPIDTDVRLTFWLTVRDRNFSNYTNLPLNSSRNHLYYFSNLSNNQADDSVAAEPNNPTVTKILFLTQPLQPYSDEKDYSFGDIITHGQGSKAITLEAATHLPKANRSQVIDSIHTNTSTPSSVKKDWLALPNSQYVSAQDRLPCQGLSYTANIRANPGDIVRLTNRNGKETVLFEVPKKHPPGTDLTISLNLAEQSPGYYQLWHNKTEIDHEFMLVDPIVGQQAFALVEISLNPFTVPTAFQLLEQEDNIQQLYFKTYRIHFRNRATRWRYHTNRKPKATLPKYFERHTTDKQTFMFTTKSPFGHYRRPQKLLTDDDKTPLPAPSPATIPDIIFEPPDSQNIKALFSDIYL